MLAFEEKAVAALVALFSDETVGVVAQLRAIELDLGLDANALPDPEAIEGAALPMDARSPLIQVFEEASEPLAAGHRHDLADVDCTVGVSFNGDSDVAAGELVARRYLQALRMCLKASPTCLGAVGQAYWTDANRTLDLTYDSTTRHGRALGVRVRVQDS